MAGGRQVMRQRGLSEEWPQWSPGLMAGGSSRRASAVHPGPSAAMEPRPDGRGKDMDNEIHGAIDTVPQWSPGLMAGGSERVVHRWEAAVPAAMEPRPDGRGKVRPDSLT